MDNNKSETTSGGGSEVPAAGSVFVGAAEEDLICDGKYVVVERGDQQRILLFKAHQTLTFGKGATQQDILLKGAVGKPFLSALKASPAPPEVVSNYKPGSNVDKGKPWKKSGKGARGVQNLFVLEQSAEPVAKIINEFYQLPDTVSSGEDNRNIHDDNSSQAIKKQDIESLRGQGVPSREILDTIITSSKSFGQKTEFAQEKYLKRKEKIYGDVLMFRKPSISILSEYYFTRDPQKVLGLRPDTLSQILSYANVHANGKYLIYENCFGLIMAAVIHRLGGNGVAFQCHLGSIPQRQALVCMNFTDDDLTPMKNLDLLYLVKPSNGTDKNVEGATLEVNDSSPAEPASKKAKLDPDNEVDNNMDTNGNQVSSSNEQTDEAEEEDASFSTSRRLRYANNKEDNEKSLEYFNETEFDGLIICAKEHPLTLFQRLTQRLGSSSPFVIYCQYPEPLMDCYVWAKEKGVGCNVHLVDNWFRNIQVETERTHPEINMSPSGGFLLFGTITGC